MTEGDKLVGVKMLVDQVAALSMVVSLEDAEALVREINRTESLMPIIDPTAWRRISKTEPDHKRVAEAFLEFRATLQSMVK